MLGAELGGARIVGIGLSGQMHGLVALDNADTVIRPAILWNDQRTGAECAEIEERIGLERLITLTGNRALTGFTAPKLLWLRRNEPDAYHRIARIMLPKDYVRLRLTGEWAIDVADASGTLLLDVAARTWSNEVLDALELPAGWLPRVLESPEVSGAHGRRRPRPGRDSGRCRGGRLRGRRGRRRDRPAGTALDRDGNLGRRVRRAAGVRVGFAGARPRVLPRRARPVARNGRDALRRWIAAVVPRQAGARGVLRRPRR